MKIKIYFNYVYGVKVYYLKFEDIINQFMTLDKRIYDIWRIKYGI